jgi:hypothetical protein
MSNFLNVVKLLSYLDGYKTWLAASGLFGLALYQLSQGELEQAVQSFMGGLAAVGIRHAVAKKDAEAKKVEEETVVEEDYK